MVARTLLPNQFQRQYGGPLDVDAVFATSSERIAYLSSPRRYDGQLVYDQETGKTYILSILDSTWNELLSSNVPNIFSKGQTVTPVTLVPDAGFITTNATSSNHFIVDLDADAYLKFPDNIEDGQILNWRISKTSPASLSVDPRFIWSQGEFPDLSLDLSAVDYISAQYFADLGVCIANILSNLPMPTYSILLRDTFSETNDTPLTSHAPDQVSSSLTATWVQTIADSAIVPLIYNNSATTVYNEINGNSYYSAYILTSGSDIEDSGTWGDIGIDGPFALSLTAHVPDYSLELTSQVYSIPIPGVTIECGGLGRNVSLSIYGNSVELYYFFDDGITTILSDSLIYEGIPYGSNNIYAGIYADRLVIFVNGVPVASRFVDMTPILSAYNNIQMTVIGTQPPDPAKGHASVSEVTVSTGSPLYLITEGTTPAPTWVYPAFPSDYFLTGTLQLPIVDTFTAADNTLVLSRAMTQNTNTALWSNWAHEDASYGSPEIIGNRISSNTLSPSAPWFQQVRLTLNNSESYGPSSLLISNPANSLYLLVTVTVDTTFNPQSYYGVLVNVSNGSYPAAFYIRMSTDSTVTYGAFGSNKTVPVTYTAEDTFGIFMNGGNISLIQNGAVIDTNTGIHASIDFISSVVLGITHDTGGTAYNYVSRFGLYENLTLSQALTT